MLPRRSLLVAFVWLASAPVPAAALTIFGLVDTGELYASTDAGASWTIRSTLPVRDAVALVAGAASSQLFLASESGTIYRSSDAGGSWSAISTVAASDVAALVAYPGRMMLMTRRGSVYTSTNTGVTFSALGTIAASDVVSGARHGAAHVALTRSGGVYRSNDDGATWTAVGALVTSNAIEIASFGGKLYVLTAAGELARSDDAGATWSFVSTLSQVAMTSLAASPTELLASTEGGETAATASGTSWAWRGVIGQLTVRALATDAAATTGIEGHDDDARAAFLPPWPNPARGEARFALDLEREAVVTVAAYDVAGREVARPVTSRLMPAGRSIQIWRPNGLPSGLYTLRAEIGGRRESRRLVWLGAR
jgi:hypothetical protein